MSLLNLLSPGKTPKTLWNGYYVQNGTEYQFRAEFLHSENKVTGKIIDLDPVNNCLTIDAYLERAPVSLSEKATYRQQIAKILRCAVTDTIYVTEKLAESSHVTGDIDGSFVSFLKTYDTGMAISFATNTRQISYRAKPYSVLYEGTLTEDGNQITGRWFLHEKEADMLQEGTFAMSRY